MLKTVAMILLFVAWGLPARAGVEFKIFTDSGFVAFSAEDDWPVISMQTKPPVSLAVFQIPNAADGGTSESTNLSVALYHLDSETARDAALRIGEPIGDGAPKIESFKEWTLFRQEAKQGAVAYVIVDAKIDLSGIAVGVRIAWPQLKKNPPGYDQQMEKVFRAVLESVYQHIGAYEPVDGEIIRRPTE
jgi:hypothetical protein